LVPIVTKGAGKTQTENPASTEWRLGLDKLAALERFREQLRLKAISIHSDNRMAPSLHKAFIYVCVMAAAFSMPG